MSRQGIRKGIILVSFLSFPVTMNYLSPYIIVDGASRGIINASFITFVLLFGASLFLGRLFCSWMCPAAGIQECLFLVRDKRAAGGKADWTKYIIWIPWMSTIVVLAVLSGGYRAIAPLHLTEKIVSVAEPIAYVNYYFVVGLFVILSLSAGRRGFCHYVCWMAPFMIIGRALRGLLKWPSLRLRADKTRCVSCETCTQSCPMSLEVHRMVQEGAMENRECILCGTCIDGCSQNAIQYTFSVGSG